MFKSLLPLLLLLLSHFVYGQYQVSRVTFPIDAEQTREKLAQAGLDLTHGSGRNRDFFTTEINSYQFSYFDQLGIRYSIIEKDMNDFRKREEAIASRENPLECQDRVYDQSIPENFEFGSIGGYMSMSEVLDQLDAMQDKYPNLISVRRPISNYKTQKNNSIFFVKLSDNPEVDENEPEILYTGLHHARELISVSELIYTMWYMLENYDSNPLIKQILQNTQLYFIPVLNPDGMNYNIEGYDPVLDSFNRNHRKNLRDNNNNGIFEPETDGVDLNRNYGHEWGHDDEGSSGYEGSDVFRGPFPFSEPETQAIRWLCNQHDFKIALNAHSYGDVLIHPWGFAPEQTPDSTRFRYYGEILTRLNGFLAGRGLETVGYNTNGDSDDWMYGSKGIFSMTPEIGGEGDAFYPPKSRIIPLCQSMLQMNIYAALLGNSMIDITDETPRFISSGTNQINLEFTQFGVYQGPVEISFKSLSPYITQIPASFETNLNAFVPYERNIHVTIDPITPMGAHLALEVVCKQGSFTFRDTLNKVRADVDLVVEEQGDITKWDTSNGHRWSTTQESYKSGPVCITDSPNDLYGPNEEQAIVLGQVINLTNANAAYAQFWTKWDIEDLFDYVVFQASTDGQNWSNLCGKLSHAGSIFQLYEEPVYDGKRSTWSLEHVDLGDFLGRNILLRFQLVTDAFNMHDGFYFDEFKVITVEGDFVSTHEIDPTEVKVFPNPSNNDFNISLPETTPFRVTIYNALGSLVHQGRSDAGFMNVQARTWAPGMYHYLIVTDEGKAIKNGTIQLIR